MDDDSLVKAAWKEYILADRKDKVAASIRWSRSLHKYNEEKHKRLSEKLKLEEGNKSG